MPTGDNTSVDIIPGIAIGCGFSGGGPLPSVWTTCFSSPVGATLEVHFYNMRGANFATKTYSLPTSGGIGAWGLLLADWQRQYGQAVGVKAYARGGYILAGQCGDYLPHENGLYLQDGASFPDVIQPNGNIRFGLMTGSHGYKIDNSQVTEAPNTGFTFQQVVTTAPVALPNNPISANMVLKNIATASAILYFGFSAGVTVATGFPLEAGATSSIITTNSDNVFVIAGSAGATACGFGS